MLFTGYLVHSQTISIRINEIMALNQSGIIDEDDEYSDWIEIYNSSQEDIDLLGWSITDERNKPLMWVFPDMTLKKESYLVIFASGKNRRNASEELHTSFKLSGGGEYLGLYNSFGNAVSEFNPSYPVQQPDISYGFSDGSYISFNVPTPGTQNNPAGGTLPAPPVFSKKHGFHDSPFTLQISGTAGTSVYYTTDGSAPGLTNGSLYSGPLTISTTAVIRAVAVKDALTLSRITTQTYLFPADIIHQPNNPAGYPSTWGPFLSIPGTAPADYEMDPEMMADPGFASRVYDALLDLPVISLVTNKEHLFLKSTDPKTGGIYIHTGTVEGLGYGWERPVSFEYFDDSDSVSLQTDCGLEIHGGEGRRPEKSPKHSFRLVFKNEYGPSKFNFPIFGDNAATEHNSIILRAGFGNTWIHWLHSERSRAQYMRDRWTKDSQLAMGHPSSHGIYVHLFINGLYWGVYNPSERMDSEFAASYLGGAEPEYDVVKDYAEAVDGTLTAWNTAISMANAGLSSDASWQHIQGNNPDGTRNPAFEPMVDAVSLADYMILNFYGGNTDWDHHNWVAIRSRVDPGKGFRFFCWDSEHMVKVVTDNILNENNDKCPSRIFQKMRQNVQFRRLFADRVQKHCFNNGVLVPEQAAARWMERAGQVDKAILAESARWGDYRRDVHPWQAAGPFELYTRDVHWIAQQDFLMDTYFPNRTINFINQLRLAGLFPSIDGPTFLINNKPLTGREISKGDALTMTAASGVIYYTTNGSDPAGLQNAVSPDAVQYTKPLTLDGSAHIKARVFYNNQWSAASDQYFIIPGDFNDLKITEIHYHPLDAADLENREFEFVEIKNTGTSALDLGGTRLTDGIEYVFPSETHLGPGSFVVLASNNKAFHKRYGFLAYDEYDGQLDNNGETILLMGPDKDTLCLVHYEDANSWPAGPDGSGTSLVPVDINPSGNLNLAELWRESYREGGSPGEDDLYFKQAGTSLELITVYQSYPNPFSESTKLGYELKEKAHVQLIMIDATGKVLLTLENSEKPAGIYEIEWKGENGNKATVSDGLYFCRIVVRNQKGTNTLIRKMILIR